MTTPDKNVKTASTRGVSCSVNHPSVALRRPLAIAADAARLRRAREPQLKAEAGNTPPDTQSVPGSSVVDGSAGFKRSAISPSNMPTPPGIWLASPSSCEARNAPRSVRNGTLPGGRSTKQDRSGDRPFQNGNPELRDRETRRWKRRLHASESDRAESQTGRGDIAQAREHQQPPDGAKTAGADAPSSRGNGPIARLSPPMRSRPSQKVTTYEDTIRESSSAVMPQRV